MADAIDTGDTVRHIPSGEEWLVACAHESSDSIHPCGWPPTRALLSDCELVEKATPEARAKLLAELAAVRDSESYDHRWPCARVRMEADNG